MEVVYSIWKLVRPKGRFFKPVFILGSSGIIFMYDVNNPDSFEGVKIWLTKTTETINIDQGLKRILVLANKTDLPDLIERDREMEILEIAEETIFAPIEFHNISLKEDPEGVKAIVLKFIRKVVDDSLPNQKYFTSNREKMILKFAILGDDGVGKNSMLEVIGTEIKGDVSYGSIFGVGRMEV